MAATLSYTNINYRINMQCDYPWGMRWMVYIYADGNSKLNIIEKGLEKDKVEKIFSLIEKNKHKLEMPQTIKIN